MNMDVGMEQSDGTLVQEGITAALAGDDIEARRKLIEATRLNPNQPDVWFWLGRVLDKPDKKLKCFQQALELDPGHEQARLALEELTDIPEITRTAETTPRRELVQAWRAALLFDGASAYDKYRGGGMFVATVGRLIGVLVLAIATPFVLPYLLHLGAFNFGDFLKFVVQAFAHSSVAAVQAALSLFVASWVASHFGRAKFGSNVGAFEHFGIIGIFYVPATAMLAALTALLYVAAELLGGVVMTTSAPYTGLVAAVYCIAQVVYSNAVIHRVQTGPAAAISAASLLSGGLAFVWLLPLTAPLLSVG